MFRPTRTITVHNAAAVLDAGLRAIASGQNEFDFSEVTVVDSSAVAILVAWQRAANLQRSPLYLINLPASLQSLATLYGIAELLPSPAQVQPRADLPHH